MHRAIGRIAPSGIDQFPIDLLAVLSFLLLCYVCFQFYDSVVDIANDISGAFINIDRTASPVREAIDNAGKGVQSGIASLLSGNTEQAWRDFGLGQSRQLFSGSTQPPRQT